MNYFLLICFIYYRSTANIVNAAHKVISSGASSQSKNIRQKMNPNRGAGSTPRIVACADGKAEGMSLCYSKKCSDVFMGVILRNPTNSSSCFLEANFVVKSIQKKLDSGEYTPETSTAVLYRTNAQSRLLEEACVNNNLPYVILGKATSFYKRREIKDCLCFLRWLYNGRDKGSMIRAFQTPSRGLGDKAIEQFDQYCSSVEQAEPNIGMPKLTALDVLLSFTSPEEDWMPTRKDAIATRPLKLFTEFAEQMHSLRDMAYAEPVETTLAHVIDGFGLISHLDKTSDSKAEFEERQRNVQELQQATRKYTKDGPCLQAGPSEAGKSPLGEFLDDVALVTETANEADEEDGKPKNKRFVVSLMTIHASKGMEFDGVFVVGNEDKNFPSSQAIQAGKGSVALEEECRLCYVAMTRAKSELFLTWRKEVAEFASNAATGFRYVKRDRSRFLDALVKKKEGSETAEASKRDGANGSIPSNDVPQRRKGQPSRSYSSTALSPPPRQRQPSSSTSAPRASSTFSAINGRSGPGRSSAASPHSTHLPRPQREFPRDPPKPDNNHLVSRFTQRNEHEVAAAPRQVQRKKKAPPARQVAASTMDSTWFYPVGSKVIHKKHGRGLVLNPPPPSDKMLVRVKFEDGQSHDVPAQGDELRPDLF